MQGVEINEEIFDKLNIQSDGLKSIQSVWKRNQYRAIVNWLTKYQPAKDASNLESIKHYLGLFRNCRASPPHLEVC